jgi:penicillin G amidase
VAYVKLGNDVCPVMYDKTFSGGRTKNNKNYAVRWTAHDKSNELKIFTLLDKAKNYSDYQIAVVNLLTPGQNCAFACKNGDIAIRTQGSWPAKWKGQGDFVMPGFDSSYLWQGMIPQNEVPFQYNPERGFVSSANQKPVDDANYPYYIGRSYPEYRGITINKKLAAMTNITPQDMMVLQTDNTDGFAVTALPLLLKNIRANDLNADEKKYYDILKNWDAMDNGNSKGPTVFEEFWDHFDSTVYNDEFVKAPKNTMHPFESSLIEAVLKDSAYKFLDNITTPQKETLADDATAAFKATVVTLKKLEAENKLVWEKYNNLSLYHLGKIPAFSRPTLSTNGGAHAINASHDTHGPSWRMIVSLTAKTEAYGVYPGGQSGNPGSKFYDNFIDQWAGGKYYTLWMMTKEEQKDNRVKWVMNFDK